MRLPCLTPGDDLVHGEVKYKTTLRASGTSMAAVGNPTARPVIQARNQVVKNASENPRLTATMTNDMTKLIPKEIINPIKTPENFGLIFINLFSHGACTPDLVHRISLTPAFLTPVPLVLISALFLK